MTGVQTCALPISQLRKIPYTLILGDNEMKDKKISYRIFGSQETTTVTWDEFLKLLKDDIETKRRLDI